MAADYDISADAPWMCHNTYHDLVSIETFIAVIITYENLQFEGTVVLSWGTKNHCTVCLSLLPLADSSKCLRDTQKEWPGSTVTCTQLQCRAFRSWSPVLARFFLVFVWYTDRVTTMAYSTPAKFQVFRMLYREDDYILLCHVPGGNVDQCL